MKALLEGLRCDPHDPWAWAGLGQVLLDQRAHAEAREPFRKAAALAPGWDRPLAALRRIERGAA